VHHPKERQGAILNTNPLYENSRQMSHENIVGWYTLVDNMPDPVARFDYEQRIVSVNKAYCDLTGIQAEDVIGKTIYEIGNLMGSAEQWADLLTHVFATGKSEQAHFRNYDVYAFPMEDHASLHVGIVVKPITGQKRIEQDQALLSEISKELVAMKDTEKTMVALGEKITRYFSAAWCMFAEMTDRETAVVTYGWNIENVVSLKGTHKVRDYFSNEEVVAFNTDQLTIVCDTQTDQRVNAELCSALGVRSFIIVPMARDGKWLFRVSVADTKPRQWRSDEIELIKEAASRIWIPLERAKSEEALRRSEERFRAIVSQATAGIYSADLNGRLTLVNEKLCGMLGYTENELLGKTIWELTDPSHLYKNQLLFSQLKMARKPFEMEKRLLRKDGETIWVSISIAPIKDAMERIESTSAVIIDITERKQAEEALQENESIQARELEHMKILQAISSKLISDGDSNDLYLQIQKAAIKLMRSDMASMQMLIPEENELELLVWDGFHADSARHWMKVKANSTTSCGQAMATMQRVIVPDIEKCAFEISEADMKAFRSIPHQGHAVNTTYQPQRQVCRRDLHTLEARAPTVRQGIEFP
jgi:PAS domain S-box-containing protein